MQDPVLARSHHMHLFIAQFQHLLQRELLVDGIASIQGASVRTLHTPDSKREVLPERMPLHTAEVIEPHI